MGPRSRRELAGWDPSLATPLCAHLFGLSPRKALNLPVAHPWRREEHARARDLLRAEGRLGKAHVTVGGEEFAVGDRLVTRVNSRDVSNRERWEVIGVDASDTHLKLRRLGGDERAIIAAPGYLEKRTENNEPAVQHAYALTTYATESKTFDSAFSLLDAGISREDFVVAVSRATGPTTAYGVAASEMLDVDLGPATRDIDDAAHDLRIGSERVAAEFAAAEVAARKRIEARPEHELIERRDQLHRKAGGEKSVSTAQEQLAALDTRIAENNERLTALANSRVPVLLCPDHAAKADVAGRCVDHLRRAGCRAVAQAVAGSTEMRATLDDLAGDANGGLVGVEAVLRASAARILGSAAGLLRIGRVPGQIPVSRPFPDVSRYVVQAVAVRGKRSHR